MSTRLREAAELAAWHADNGRAATGRLIYDRAERLSRKDFSMSTVTTRGVDLSHHNGTDLQFHELKAAGVQFVILKATQGTSYVDPVYRGNRIRAHAAGLIVGSYHFFDDSDPVLQARHFVDVAKPRPGELVLALDVETEFADVGARAHTAVKEIKHLTGYYPWLYSGDAFYHDHLAGAITECPLWIARYGAKPRATCAMWQDTDSLALHGISAGSIDGDLYYGSLADLVAKHTVR